MSQGSVQFVSEAGLSAPDVVSPVGDELSADGALSRLKRGEWLLYRGDFRNAKQLLSALKRRLEKRPRSRAKSVDLRAKFIAERDLRANAHAALSRLLVPLDGKYLPQLSNAPDLSEACAAAWGPPQGHAEVWVSLAELLGVVGAFEWRKKGVVVEGLPGKIHPHYGVFPPTRGDYPELIRMAPRLEGKSVFEVGCGTGVLSFLALENGAASVLATDLDPRAVACANENAERLGYAGRFRAVAADLFPDGRADLVIFNPPWLPVTPKVPSDRAVYDPGGTLLRRFLEGLPAHLEEGGEGWLILSDLAERLSLRPRGDLKEQFERANLAVDWTGETSPRHGRSTDRRDPLYEARAAERVILYALRRK